MSGQQIYSNQYVRTADSNETVKLCSFDLNDSTELQYIRIGIYINGTLVATLNNAGVSPDAVLYATVTACSTTTTSKTVDVDYIKVVASR